LVTDFNKVWSGGGGQKVVSRPLAAWKPITERGKNIDFYVMLSNFHFSEMVKK
jgi:hypothetical protein